MSRDKYLSLFAVLTCSCVGVLSTDPKYFIYSTQSGPQKPIQIVYKKNAENGDWQAQAAFTNASNAYGWNMLDLKTNANKSDDMQMYHAGYLEGYLTSKEIEYHWTNTQKDMCNNTKSTCDKVNEFIDANLKYIESMTSSNMNDPYWYQVHLYYKQFDGLCDGYNASNPKLKLTKRQLLWQSMAMDMMELRMALANETEKDFIKNYGHCSAMIKLLPDNKGIVFGHVAWITFNWMTRFIKRYDFSVHVTANSSDIIPGKKMAFSSYPGLIYSMDDFYLIESTKLVAIETTNNVYNAAIYKDNVNTSLVLEAVRNSVANRLATNGSSWAKYFAKLNSGTYNNQFMILDLNKFTPGKTPANDTLWLVEQMPGKVTSADITSAFVNKTVFTSYNIPYFTDIYEYSGTLDKYNHYGDWFSHENCTRAKLFRRLHRNVTDIASLIHTLRYNHYRDDAESICEKCSPKPNPCESISARCDLYPENGNVSYPYHGHDMFGGIDVKVSSNEMFTKGEIISIAGPSPSDDLTVFSWSKSNSKMPHDGQPDTFNFKQLTTRWNGFDYPSAASTGFLAWSSFLPLLVVLIKNHLRELV